MHEYRRKTIRILFALLLVFSLIAVYAYMQLQKGVAIFDIGLSATEENLIVLALSVLSMIKVVYEIYRVEHHSEYEERVKEKLQRS